MTVFVLKRFGSLLASLLVASLVIFLVLEVLPGDPAAFMLGLAFGAGAHTVVEKTNPATDAALASSPQKIEIIALARGSFGGCLGRRSYCCGSIAGFSGACAWPSRASRDVSARCQTDFVAAYAQPFGITPGLSGADIELPPVPGAGQQGRLLLELEFARTV
jgi:hypothetical protein